MTRTVGVRELKNQATRIVRAVREERAEYVVTVNGEPVAVLRPFCEEDAAAIRRGEAEAAIARMDAVAKRISASVEPGTSLVETLFEMREERQRSLEGLDR